MDSKHRRFIFDVLSQFIIDRGTWKLVLAPRLALIDQNWTKISNKISKFVSSQIIRLEIVTENVRIEAKRLTAKAPPSVAPVFPSQLAC